MKYSEAKQIVGRLMHAGTIGTEDLIERKRNKWECACGKQCTRKRVINGKILVICRNCEEVLSERV
jgi:predicted SprT family Zn-dependent metalloprotease